MRATHLCWHKERSMQEGTTIQRQPISKGRRWAGYVLSAIPVLLLLMGAAFDLSGSEQAVQGAAQMGYPAHTVRILGALALICAVVYAIPRTAFLGAILMSAYFGAAVATHIRAGQPLYWTLPAIIVCSITWFGLYLREPRLKELLPVRR
jgi:amino acid transporter